MELAELRASGDWRKSSLSRIRPDGHGTGFAKNQGDGRSQKHPIGREGGHNHEDSSRDHRYSGPGGFSCGRRILDSPELRAPGYKCALVREGRGFSRRRRLRGNAGFLRATLSIRSPDPAASGVLAGIQSPQLRHLRRQDLQGAKTGDLPAEQPTKFHLVINLDTAKALGLMISQSILIRSDEVAR